MTEVYIITLAFNNLYLKDIGDNLKLSFADNSFDAMFFTEDLAKETAQFLNSNTPHFLKVESLNDTEDAPDKEH